MSRGITGRVPTGYRVTARNRKEIRDSAQELRDLLGIAKPFVNVVSVVESLVASGFMELEILENGSLPSNDLGQTTLIRDESGEHIPLIKLEQRVYDGANNGNGRDRFTIAHEIGHAFLHIYDLRLSRSTAHRAKKEWFRDSEWQANVFASEFLVDDRLMHSLDDELSLMRRFGVSYDSAKYRLDQRRKEKR